MITCHGPAVFGHRDVKPADESTLGLGPAIVPVPTTASPGCGVTFHSLNDTAIHGANPMIRYGISKYISSSIEKRRRLKAILRSLLPSSR
jgi:hypothetical protein